MNPIIFAGPSLNKHSRVLIKKYGLEMRPPIRRGDMDHLNESGIRATVIIVDGRFKEVLAVGHAEIRRALKNGCKVFGLASMGAIRAYEMETMGMKGYGKVFQYFKKEEDFQDDEVALLHAEEPFYFSFSEPMVHFRECVNDWVCLDLLKENEANLIIQSLKNRYFGERTMDLFIALVKNHSDIDPRDLLHDFDKYRIKQLDLIRFLEGEIWK